MAESTAVAVIIFVVLTVSAVVSGIDDKCAACNAFAEELESGLSNEKPRKHLDMRHRLDSKGQREGKLIDYRVSELRVVELLDGLCEKMQDYTLQCFVDQLKNGSLNINLHSSHILNIDSTRHEWIRVDDWDNLTANKQEAQAHSKHISSYCGRLLEETEDELTELIKKGSIKVGGVSKVLCQDLSKHCTKSSGSLQPDEEDDDDVESKGEL